MTVKTAFKYIFIGLLTCFLLLVGYVVQAGIAIVHVKTPDTRLWVPVPVALGHIAGNLIDMPLKMEKDFQEVWQYREAAADILQQLPGLPDADFVEVRSGREQVRIFKRDDFLFVQVEAPKEKVNIRLPIHTVERLVEVLSDPHASVGALLACLEWQSAGDLVHVKTENEEIRISLW
ncbi:MAG: hypothetical protein L0387_17070 [Acidobacteria bacterium]|nr:hypothetical protein [Acidobacteriota bacterium]MCI0623344.1 hypothetical protein [Acidobacteriota bacterium]MCI0717651.1 hypothetical protein [Acidobacteriota bacterium]